MKYEKRVTVFLDILGFKQLIKSTEIKEEDVEENFSKSKRITHFSDSIVISFNENEESEIFYTLSEIQNLIINLIYKGIICRGGIAYGKLIHNEKMIFGLL
jgi:hypothetical protein